VANSLLWVSAAPLSGGSTDWQQAFAEVNACLLPLFPDCVRFTHTWAACSSTKVQVHWLEVNLTLAVSQPWHWVSACALFTLCTAPSQHKLIAQRLPIC
jgi:hypothetical protein